MYANIEEGGGYPEKPLNLDRLIKNLNYAMESSALPIAKNRSELKEAFKNNDNLILEADPGSGKSTVAPIIFLNELLDGNPHAKIAITQPRRLATSSVAQFVGGEVGDNYVDYRFKGHGFSKPESRIEFSVVESLLKELTSDPILTKYDAVMVDEVHERSIPIDILLPLLKIAQQKRKETNMKQLKIVLASATLDAQVLNDYYPDAKRIHIEGVPYQVDEHFSNTPVKPEQVMEKAAEKVSMLFADNSKSGDALIFMPGSREIAETEELIKAKINDPDVEIVKIKGGEQEVDPYKIINNNPGNKRRIYIATDAAETSITIPGITMVIDSGLMKRPVYDPLTRITTLETQNHTKGNWTQRKRRAGRTQKGEAYALFTKEGYQKRSDHQIAEFLRTDLTPQVLKMKASGIHDVLDFPYIEHPGSEKLNQAIESLQKLGALDSEGKITPIGQEMDELDMDPHLSRIIVEGKKRNCIDAASLIVSAMQMKDSIFSYDRKSEKFLDKYKNYIDKDSDFITFLNIWNDYITDPKNSEKWQEKGFNPKALSRIEREANNLKREIGIQKGGRINQIDTQSQKNDIELSIASGLIHNILVGDGYKYRFEGGSSSGIEIDKTSFFYHKFSGELLSGKIHSTKKGHSARSFSQMNMKFNREKLLSEFKYLEKFFKTKHQEAPVQQKKEQAEIKMPSSKEDQEEQKEVAITYELQSLQKKAIDEPSEPVKKETETFIMKIRENWHQLTDKIKEMFASFKNAVKKIFK